jgi:hypothetical protein
MLGDDVVVERQLIAHRDQHLAGMIKLGSEAEIKGGNAGHALDLTGVSLRRREQ